MEEVIKRIIKIEEQARKTMAKTLEQNEKKRKDTEEALKVLEEKLITETNMKVKELRKRELRENADAAKVIRKECDSHIRFMETRAKENEEEWIRYLVDKVLGE